MKLLQRAKKLFSRSNKPKPDELTYEELSNSPAVFEVEDPELYALRDIGNCHIVVSDDQGETRHFLRNFPFFRLQDDELKAHPERYAELSPSLLSAMAYNFDLTRAIKGGW